MVTSEQSGSANSGIHIFFFHVVSAHQVLFSCLQMIDVVSLAVRPVKTWLWQDTVGMDVATTASLLTIQSFLVAASLPS